MNEFVNNELEKLTADILSSYDKTPKIRRIGEVFLPSRSKIVKILEQIRRLLFPGYFGHKKLTDQNVQYHVGNLLMKLAAELTEEICHCMCSDRSCEPCDTPEQCRREADQIARDFLGRVPEIRRMLGLDAQAAYDGDPAAKSIDEIVYCYPGFYAIAIYRVAHELLDLGVPLMPRIMTEYAHSQTGADIHPAATIGESFFIDHATGVIIGETTVIGCGECRRKVNFNKYVTGISTEGSVDSPPGSGSVVLSIPDNDVNEFYVDGQFTIIPMMEIEFFAKGYFTVGGFPQYYRIFWGLVSSVSKTWSNGVTTINISCRDILRWWEITNVILQPGFLEAGNSAGGWNLFQNRFSGANPYVVIITLGREAMGDFSHTTGSFMSFKPEKGAEQGTI
ncbi:hypothetical protein LCGC14_2369160, partial [marine sediment metagenome]